MLLEVAYIETAGSRRVGTILHCGSSSPREVGLERRWR